MDHTITQDDLFNKWCKHGDEPWLLASLLGITPAQLADLTDNPIFAKRVAAWRALALAHREELVFNHQQAAAITLRETMSSPDPIEARRAATTLAHLSRNMLRPVAGGTGRGGATQRGTALPDGEPIGHIAQDATAQGGTALQSGASEHPTPPPSAAPSTPSTPSPTPPEPPNPPLPFDAPLPLPLVASSPQVVTKLTARAGAARAAGP